MLWQPWKSSTGARTNEGMTICSRNAYKGGVGQQLKSIRRILRDQKKAIKDLM
jgi:hypothetical protein